MDLSAGRVGVLIVVGSVLSAGGAAVGLVGAVVVERVDGQGGIAAVVELRLRVRSVANTARLVCLGWKSEVLERLDALILAAED